MGAIAGACVSPMMAQSLEELNFLSDHTDFRHLRSQFSDSVRRQAVEMLEARRSAAQRWTAEEITGRKQYLRERMLRALGGLPERTPLNPRITGTIEREDYRIEKVVFESQPKFFVTANLYLPKSGAGPYPGILFPLGHEEGGKSNPAWQYMLVSLAKKGYVALAWDPLGQGERVQLWDEDFRTSKVVRSTTEHTVLGTQTLLAGDSVARYTVWDGMRALDYLLSRPEVDKTRIGCTGNSGGGTHTAYLSALDDRIHVAAPSCFITSWRRLLESIGPQDAEQCLPPWIADGLDHADFILAFAPKPYLILSAIRDFFSITGARETFREVKHSYEVLGAGEKMAMFEADDGHGYNKLRRLAAYRWFGRWLKGSEDNEPEPEVTLATEEELFCTPTGQVATSFSGETVSTLNRKRAQALKRSLLQVDQVRKLISYNHPAGAVTMRPFGILDRRGYRIEKLVYETGAGLVVPSLLYLPQASGRRPAVILVDGRGKASAHPYSEELALAGTAVLSIDIRGLGETRSASDENGSDWPRYFGDFEDAMTALLTARTLVGMRAADISRAVDLLATRAEVDPDRVSAMGKGGAAISVLHAAAADSRIRKVALDGMLISYQSVVDRNINRGVFEDVIPGVLKSYDLPDLVSLISPRPVRIVDAVDPVGQLVPLKDVQAAYKAANVAVLRRHAADTAVTLYGFEV